MPLDIKIRECNKNEFARLGQLMVEVYSQLPNFPNPEDQPKYYKLLANIDEITSRRSCKLIVALNVNEQVIGGGVYIGEMDDYGSDSKIQNADQAAGFRLLAVDPKVRGHGVGKSLIESCVSLARKQGRSQLIIHSTKAMSIAWRMYEKMGFRRSIDLDFIQSGLEVFGFRLIISIGVDKTA